jgi:DNA-binding LacI/PurR family transcriptional regulator
MTGKATLRQLADTAGVSLSTVSRLVNGSAPVKRELEERVREAAQKLDIDLEETNRTRTVAFVFSNREMLHSFHSRILLGAQAQCAHRGWDMLFLNFEYPAKVQWNDLILPPILRRRDVARAVLLVGANSENLLMALVECGMPFTVLGNNLVGELPDRGGDAVYSDDIQGSYEMTRYLLGLQHKNIWYLGNSQLPWLSRCLMGYRKAMAEAELQPLISEVDSANEQEIGYLGAKSILSNKGSVSAIFAGTDHIAAGVFKAAADLGLRIPEDLSVAGCNDTYGEMLQPRLTSIHEFPEQLGKQLVDLSLSRIQQLDMPPRRITIPTEVIKRESCQPPFPTRHEAPVVTASVLT